MRPVKQRGGLRAFFRLLFNLPPLLLLLLLEAKKLCEEELHGPRRTSQSAHSAVTLVRLPRV